MGAVRLNKFLSLCGVTSRRGAENYILDSRVTVNGETVSEVGKVIELDTDVVAVDGEEIKPVEEKIYVILNKPKQVMTTLHDPFRRRTVKHLLKDLEHRVYPVGRLDYDTAGILLLTNDGDVAFRLAHPKYKVEKIYEAVVSGSLVEDDIKKIEKGIKLEDGAIGKAMVSILSYKRNTTRIRLVLTEGRKREVKQLCKAVGKPVKQLVRVEFARLTARGLAPGEWRLLKQSEINMVNSQIGL